MAKRFEITGTIFSETNKAVKVGVDGSFYGGGGFCENADIVWLPKSQIELFRGEYDNYRAILPGWLAHRKGLSNHPQAVFGVNVS